MLLFRFLYLIVIFYIAYSTVNIILYIKYFNQI